MTSHNLRIFIKDEKDEKGNYTLVLLKKRLNQSEFQTLNLTGNLHRKLHTRYPSDRKTISATKTKKIIFKILYYYTSLFTEKDRTPKRKSILQRTRRMQIKRTK